MANNPHAETYKGSTTFSGPIKAGSRWLDVPNYDRETVPGTIAVKDLPNAGFVVCSQSAAIGEQGANTTITDIVLPSGSMILSIQAIVTTAFGDTMAFVINPLGTVLYALTQYADLSAVGVYNLATTGLGVPYWKNVSNTPDVGTGFSVDIRTDGSGSGTGPGRGILTVNDIPGLNL